MGRSEPALPVACRAVKMRRCNQMAAHTAAGGRLAVAVPYRYRVVSAQMGTTPPALDADIAEFLADPFLIQPPANWPHSADSVATARIVHENKARYVTRPEHRFPVAAVRGLTIPGPAQPVELRIYEPIAALGPGKPPLVLWLHGGGWMTGSLDTGDTLARAVCSALGAIVVSVDYRLAPENPWPAGLDDCTAALQWLGTHAEDLGGDPARIVVGGDSAGGNLAAVLAQNPPSSMNLAAQLLLYPAVDLDPRAEQIFPSRTEKGQEYGLGPDEVRDCFEQYIAGADATDPQISPLRAPTVAGLPPAVIATAEHDPLRDEGRAYAEALHAAGVEVVLHDGHGLVHGCFDMLGISATAATELGQVLESLRAAVPAQRP